MTKELTEFKPSPIGKIPRDWEVVRLKDIGELQDGDWILKENYVDSGVRLIQVGDIGVGRFLNKSKRFISLKSAEELRCKFVDSENHILISRMPDPIGRACLAPKLPYPYIVAVDITMFKPDFNQADRWFLIYMLNYDKNLERLNRIAIGATRKRISRKNLAQFKIPLPPLPEQKRIAEILQTVDEGIEKVEQEIEHTERLKKGLMQRLLTRGIGHKEFKDSPIGKIPEDWQVVKVSEIGEVVTGTTPPTKNKNFWGGEIPFVTPSDFKGRRYVTVTERTVTSEGADKAKIIPRDSVMVVCIASVGEVAMASTNCITNQQINSIVCKPDVDPHYVYYALLFKKDQLKAWAGVTTTPIVKKSLFEKFPIPLPPPREQRKIAEILITTDRKLELLRQKKERLQLIKKGLMNELLTGKRRVKIHHAEV